MTTEALLWLALTGLAGWNLKLQWWVAQHHKSCHSAPMAAAAALAVRVAGCEEENARLAKNWHEIRVILQRVILTLATKGIMVRLDHDQQ